VDCTRGCIDELGRIVVPHEGLAEVVLREDGRLFATAGWDHRVRLFETHTLQPLAILKEHTETVQCVAMNGKQNGIQESYQSGLIATGSKDAKIALYQLYPDHPITPALSDHSHSTVMLKHETIFKQLHPTNAQHTAPLPPADSHP
jgi:WD40 repeat protein